jgi:hypothetical protein
MGAPVAQADQGGRQPVEEHQPVPGTGPDRPPPRPIGQACVLARLPARAKLDGQLDGQLGEDFPGQPGHPAIGDRGGSRQAPRHTPTLPRSSRAGHGSLLVDDRLEDLQITLGAGDPHLPRPGRCWGGPLKGVGAAGVVEHLDPLRLPILRQSMTADHLCNCPLRSRNRQEVGRRPYGR